MPCLWRSCRSFASSLRLYSTVARDAVVLRPYQESCLDACVDALKKGATRIGVSLPTGAGKTTVFISLLSRIPTPALAPEATRSLIIVNSVELARQTAEQTRRLFPEWSVEIEQGKHQASGTADVTVATFQTLLRSNRLEKFPAQYLKALIVDEAHHAAAPAYRRILSCFDHEIKHPDETFTPPAIQHRIPILGFSATFSRHDGLALSSVFQEIVYHRDFLEMIKEQWLCNVRFTTVLASIDLSNVTVNSRSGDFNPTSLGEIVDTDTVNELIVRTWLDKAAERKSTLVFCVTVGHVHRVTAAFKTAGVDARQVHAGTPAAERRTLLQAFKNGEFPVLVNCAVLTEGADIPNIDCVLVARPTKSRNVYAQMIGRGMRLSPNTGKEDCRIIDIVESQQRVGGVVSVPTLLGLDPLTLNQDETLESLEQRLMEKRLAEDEDENHLVDEAEDTNELTRNRVNGNVPRPKSVIYIDHDDPFALADQGSGDPNLHSITRNAWVCCGDSVYVLECLGKGFIRIDPVEGDHPEGAKFSASYTPTTLASGTASMLKISPFRRSKKISDAATLGDAVRGCDTYAKSVVQGPMNLALLRSARWRFQPATPNQMQIVLKRWHGRKAVSTVHDGEKTSSKEVMLNQMTKGEAANIITRLKHGAMKRYEKKQELAKRELLKKIYLPWQARQEVKVGPLPVPA